MLVARRDHYRRRFSLGTGALISASPETAVFLATWATGSFYQALVPALVQDLLHTTSPLTLGLVFAAYMAFSALGAPIGGWFTPATSQRIGMLAFSAAMTGIIIAVTSGRLRLFIAATAFTVVAPASPARRTNTSTHTRRACGHPAGSDETGKNHRLGSRKC